MEWSLESIAEWFFSILNDNGLVAWCILEIMGAVYIIAMNSKDEYLYTLNDF